MMSNIKKYVREFSTVTVTSDCGCKTFTRLNRGGVYHWINVLPNGKLNEPSSEMTEQESVYHWINVFPNGKPDDSSVEITEQDFVALLEIFSKAGMRVKFRL